MCRYTLLLISFVSCFMPVESGKSEEINVEKLVRLSDIAKAICEEVKDSGSAEAAKVQGDVQAKLSLFFKEFPNANLSGKLDGSVEHWNGVLQKDLPKALENVTRCRVAIVKEFVDADVALRTRTHDKEKAKMLQADVANALSEALNDESGYILRNDSASIQKAYPIWVEKTASMLRRYNQSLEIQFIAAPPVVLALTDHAVEGGGSYQHYEGKKAFLAALLNEARQQSGD